MFLDLALKEINIFLIDSIEKLKSGKLFTDYSSLWEEVVNNIEPITNEYTVKIKSEIIKHKELIIKRIEENKIKSEISGGKNVNDKSPIDVNKSKEAEMAREKKREKTNCLKKKED